MIDLFALLLAHGLLLYVFHRVVRLEGAPRPHRSPFPRDDDAA